QEGLRRPDEPRPAADRAERVDDPLVLREMARSRPIDGHPTDRVLQRDIVGDGLDRGHSRTSRAPCGRGAGRRDEGRAPTPDLDELGEDRQGDLLGGLCATVEARWAPEGGQVATTPSATDTRSR